MAAPAPVATAIGGPATASDTAIGAVVADAATGFTLYTFDRDQPGQPACVAACLLDWPPFAAPEGATASGDWTVVDRADTIRQWAFRGRLLYFSTQDQQRGDTKGHGVDGAWQAARP